MNLICRLTATLFLLIVFPISVFALPFGIGERLEFTLKWGGISAGKTVMEVPEAVDLNGRAAFHIVSASKSSGFVSTFYKLNNRIDCYVNQDTLSLLKYETVSDKNGRKRSKSAIIYPETGEIKFTRNNEVSTHKVPVNVNGSLSIFYFIRTLDLEPGNEYKIDTFSNGKLYETIVNVMGKETIRVEAGSFETVKVKTIIKDSDLFKSRGETEIWFSDDLYKMPIRIKTKIKVGHITAELKKADKGETIAKGERFSSATTVKGNSINIIQ